ncbi:MAG: pilus assembly protein PilM, partial [Candidatus Omnitrophica bacterium]|nr:pilus assembly protein PilM [Candidatus Omnitrophota bacterium]
NRPVDKILLTGGSAHLKGMLDFMKHYLGQNIELINFNENKFKLNPSLDAEKFKEYFNFFTFSLGMALRGF